MVTELSVTEVILCHVSFKMDILLNYNPICTNNSMLFELPWVIISKCQSEIPRKKYIYFSTMLPSLVFKQS